MQVIIGVVVVLLVSKKVNSNLCILQFRWSKRTLDLCTSYWLCINLVFMCSRKIQVWKSVFRLCCVHVLLKS